MNKVTTPSRITAELRRLSDRPGLSRLKYAFRNLQAWFNYPEFQYMKQLIASPSLAEVLKYQPKLQYKYFGHYAAASFSRAQRLTAILNHYQFLDSKVNPSFFSAIADCPSIWQESYGEDTFTIWLTYPLKTHFEGEVSLCLSLNSTLIQTITFLIVPGELVGASIEQALLISQVQGTKDFALIKQATKTLYDITPAALLINAAYGLAAALGLTHVVGISTSEQLCSNESCYFDYDVFWQQFANEKTQTNLFLLDIATPEKPISEVKSNHRARTLRKRQYKQQVRTTVAQRCEGAFLKQPWCA